MLWTFCQDSHFFSCSPRPKIALLEELGLICRKFAHAPTDHIVRTFPLLRKEASNCLSWHRIFSKIWMNPESSGKAGSRTNMIKSPISGCISLRDHRSYYHPMFIIIRIFVVESVSTNLVFSLSLGMLSQSYWDSARLCRGLVKPRLRVQRPGWDLARHPPLREGSRSRPKLSGRLHQSGQCFKGSENLWQVWYKQLIN